MPGGAPVTLVSENGPAISATNPLPVNIAPDLTSDLQDEAIARSQHDLLVEINLRLGALLILLAPVYANGADPLQFVTAARSLNITNPN